MVLHLVQHIVWTSIQILEKGSFHSNPISKKIPEKLKERSESWFKNYDETIDKCIRVILKEYKSIIRLHYSVCYPFPRMYIIRISLDDEMPESGQYGWQPELPVEVKQRQPNSVNHKASGHLKSIKIYIFNI